MSDRAATRRWAVAVVPLLLALLRAAAAHELQPLEAKKCPEAEDVATMNNLTVARSSQGFQAWLDVRMPRPAAYISRAVLRLVQCPTGQPCKHFYTMRFSRSVCALMADKMAFWSTILTRAQPPLTCPIQQRVYHIRNATIDVSHFLALFSAAGERVNRPAIWRGRLEAADESVKQLVCMIVKYKFS